MAITFSHTQRSTMGGGTKVSVGASDDTIDTLLFWKRHLNGLGPTKMRESLVSAASRVSRAGKPAAPMILTTFTDGACLMIDYEVNAYYLSARDRGGQAAHALKSAMAEIRMLEAVALANYRAHQCVTKFFDKGRTSPSVGRPVLRVMFNQVDNFGRPVRNVFEKHSQAPEGCTSRPRPGRVGIDGLKG